MKLHPLQDDHFHDECGVFGIFGHPEAAGLTYLGLHALQHRGQESAGIVSSDGEQLHSHRGMGLVHDVFTESVLARLPGSAAIGHVRYSTTGESFLKNAQPFAVQYANGSLALGHNGNLVNAAQVRAILEDQGSIFSSTSDTEVIVHLVARSRERTLRDRVIDALSQVQGAYSLVVLSQDELVAVRDPHGFRPLVLGKQKRAHVVASETCVLELIEATYLREVQPGEIIVIGKDGLQSTRLPFTGAPAACIFEHIYFARPDSTVFGRSVHQMRTEFGRQLAREHPAEADIVIPVPDSGVPAAIGFAHESGIPFEMGIVRSHYIGRTFIEPQQSIRHFGVKLKLAPIREIIEGKRVVVVDDSIVRGTTSRKIVRLIREAGAREIHMRISSPPTTHSCHYGIDTPHRSELIASSHDASEINKFITSDTLGYLSVQGMHAAMRSQHGGFCDACFTGNYPVPIPPNPPVRQLRLVGL